MTDLEAMAAVVELISLARAGDHAMASEVIEKYSREDLEDVLKAALSFSEAIIEVPDVVGIGPDGVLKEMGIRVEKAKIDEGEYP